MDKFTIKDGKRVLQCHSRGDTRFSPFFCTVEAFGVKRSIEEHYQCSKVFRKNPQDTSIFIPINWREAKSMEKSKEFVRDLEFFMLPADVILHPIKYHVYGWYSSLWLKYLDLNPKLVEEASTYDDYEDVFKWDFPLCQADCIRLYCKQGRQALLDTCQEFFDYLKEKRK